MQGEAYEEEEDSCTAAEACMPQHTDPDADMGWMPAHAEQKLQSSASEWQQAYDATYACFYYYRERTQVM